MLPPLSVSGMLVLAIHLRVEFTKLLGTGSVRTGTAESLLLKHQLVIGNRFH